jgi:regulator of ribonuclease activity A
MTIATTDLCDEHGDELRILTPIFSDYGGRPDFSGEVVTVRCFEDNSLVRDALDEPGEHRVLVVDGGGSMRCALLGDRMASLARDHGWSGVLVYGCVRDSQELSVIDLGIKALNVHPRRSVKLGAGERDVAVTLAGATLRPGDWLYADPDGVVVAERPLI